ncbi:hypothetical protein C8F01DRAFT_1260409 [Mycena amicta]|nr:hypothetical protein C8F01DRAFT_1260409 [Mycena amicta]
MNPASSDSWRAFFIWCLCIKMQDDVKVPADRDAAAPLIPGAISTSEPTSTPGMSIPSS